MDFLKKKQTQLKVLFIEERPQRMTDTTDYYAGDRLLSFLAAVAGRSLGSVERFGLTRMRFSYTEMVARTLSSRRDDAWVQSEQTKLQSAARRLKIGFKKSIALYCYLTFFTLKFHSLDHAVHELKGFASYSFMDVGTFENLMRFYKKRLEWNLGGFWLHCMKL